MTTTSSTAPAVIFTGTPRRAAFNPLIRPYLLITIGFTLFVTIIGIPLAIIWVLGAGQWWTRHYFDRLDCTLDDKVLRFRKGILFQVEKTIPLENIQDVAFIEGPLLRHFNLSTLKFETAGSSHGEAANMPGASGQVIGDRVGTKTAQIWRQAAPVVLNIRSQAA